MSSICIIVKRALHDNIVSLTAIKISCLVKKDTFVMEIGGSASGLCILKGFEFDPRLSTGAWIIYNKEQWKQPFSLAKGFMNNLGDRRNLKGAWAG